MRYIRTCVVLICVVATACFLSFIANQKTSKKEKARQEKASSPNTLKKDFVEKISANKAPEWMLQQITEDFLPFAASGFNTEMLDTVMREAEGGGELVRFRILDNQISVVDQGKLNMGQRLESMRQVLSTLCEMTPLPNMDFIISLGDALDGMNVAAPVLVFAKHKDSNKVVLIPDFEALSNQGVHLLHIVEQGINKYPWNKKISKAFWRGATTGGMISKDSFLSIPRSQAVKFSLERPSLIDARFTDLVQCDDPELVQEHFSSYFSKPLPVKNHLKYKYQLLIDGNTCAYSRAYWQLFSNCAILKQSSPNLQWFYGLLKPYVHYIPLQNDLSDLPEKILWSKDHDKEVRNIISNAQMLAQENLKQADVYYYLYLTLLEYAKMQKDPDSSLPAGNTPMQS